MWHQSRLGSRAWRVHEKEEVVRSFLNQYGHGFLGPWTPNTISKTCHGFSVWCQSWAFLPDMAFETNMAVERTYQLSSHIRDPTRRRSHCTRNTYRLKRINCLAGVQGEGGIANGRAQGKKITIILRAGSCGVSGGSGRRVIEGNSYQT